MYIFSHAERAESFMETLKMILFGMEFLFIRI